MALRFAGSDSTGPQTTEASGYVARPVVSTRTSTSDENTRHPQARARVASSAMTFAVSAPCSKVPPAIAKTWPSNHSCFSTASRSRSTKAE